MSRPASHVIDESDNEWHSLLPQLALSGMTSQLAQHCLLDHIGENEVILNLDNSGATLKSERTETQLSEALSAHLGRTVRVVLNLSDLNEETPEKRRERVRNELQQFAVASIENDAFVQYMQRLWGASVIPGSVKPYVDE